MCTEGTGRAEHVARQEEAAGTVQEGSGHLSQDEDEETGNINAHCAKIHRTMAN